jgi:hypothetical protein
MLLYVQHRLNQRHGLSATGKSTGTVRCRAEPPKMKFSSPDDKAEHPVIDVGGADPLLCVPGCLDCHKAGLCHLGVSTICLSCVFKPALGHYCYKPTLKWQVICG